MDGSLAQSSEANFFCRMFWRLIRSGGDAIESVARTVESSTFKVKPDEQCPVPE